MAQKIFADGALMRPHNTNQPKEKPIASEDVSVWVNKLMSLKGGLDFLNQENETGDHNRVIERIYSRQEIRTRVASKLIPLFQKDEIIDAVTDVLYRIHVTK